MIDETHTHIQRKKLLVQDEVAKTNAAKHLVAVDEQEDVPGLTELLLCPITLASPDQEIPDVPIMAKSTLCLKQAPSYLFTAACERPLTKS